MNKRNPIAKRSADATSIVGINKMLQPGRCTFGVQAFHGFAAKRFVIACPDIDKFLVHGISFGTASLIHCPEKVGIPARLFLPEGLNLALYLVRCVGESIIKIDIENLSPAELPFRAALIGTTLPDIE